MHGITHFVVGRAHEVSENSRANCSTSAEPFVCVDLSTQRPHETAVDSPWDAFCARAGWDKPREITAEHRYICCDAVGSKLLEVDESAQRDCKNAEQRAHVIETATNRCELLLGPREWLAECRECFVTSATPTGSTEFDIRASLQIQSLVETADYQCHRSWIEYLNRVAAAYQSGASHPFAHDLSWAADVTRSEFDTLASRLLPVEASYLPVELRDGSATCAGVLRLDQRGATSYSAKLFLAKKDSVPRPGMKLVRVASVMCGTRLVTFESHVATVTDLAERDRTPAEGG